MNERPIDPPEPEDYGYHIVHTCDICRETIYDCDAHYHLPDDSVICDVCLDDWGKQYKVEHE